MQNQILVIWFSGHKVFWYRKCEQANSRLMVFANMSCLTQFCQLREESLEWGAWANQIYTLCDMRR